MKRVLFLLLSLVAISMPAQTWAQQPSSSNFNNYYISDMCGVVDLNQRVYNISKWGTIGGATVAAVSSIVYMIGVEKTRNSGSDIASLEQGVGLMGMLFGGMSVVASLPFYLWGLHLESLPDGSALVVGKDPRGWGGVVDFDCGVSNTIALGGSFGYNFGHRLYVGLGAECEYDFDEEWSEYGSPYVFPAYVDVRLKLGKSRIVPYVGLKGGFELSSVPVPYGSVEWGVSHQPKDSRGAWWYSLSLSSEVNPIAIRIARSF